MGQDEGRGFPHQSPQTLLGSAWHPASCAFTSGARVGLYLCCCCAWSRVDDLVSLADLDNTAMMNRFLEHVSQSFENYFIVMQVDQAGWHRSKELIIPANIRLIEQPAYSPEVNQVSHLWEELREK
jgi:DDE superfamily endonuclease